ncbi:MAG: aminotransferase class V-fold PLP-dependent enzyme [Planctomycetota bacterium]|nr:MAG: aminotransferase class V-fold PLP-dependent enzyme [Planctomycetota bacterium]
MAQEINVQTDRWQRLRAAMPVAQKWIYLDHAGVAPISAPARDAVLEWADETTFDGASNWSKWDRGVQQARRTAATMVGSSADEIALVKNTTAGICVVAEGYPWREGDNIVVPANEFPSNLYPWMILEERGVETRRVPVDGGRLDVDRMAAACDERTRIVSASWISYSSGWRNDVATLAQMAHDKGALFFLDAIQGLGIFPLDVEETGIDFLAADGHKWLLGPEGAGVLYVRREHLDLLATTGVGWNSVVHAREFGKIDLDLKPNVERFEGGTQNQVGFLGLGASLDLLVSLDIAAIAERILEITEFTCEKLREAGAEIACSREPGRASGIVSFTLPGVEVEGARNRMLAEGIVLSERGGRLRVSPHAYNTEEEMERVVETLQRGT